MVSILPLSVDLQKSHKALKLATAAGNLEYPKVPVQILGNIILWASRQKVSRHYKHSLLEFVKILHFIHQDWVRYHAQCDGNSGLQ